MRKIVLRINEENKYKIIKRLVEKNGNNKISVFNLVVPQEPSIALYSNKKRNVRIVWFMVIDEDFRVPPYLQR